MKNLPKFLSLALLPILAAGAVSANAAQSEANGAQNAEAERAAASALASSLANFGERAFPGLPTAPEAIAAQITEIALVEWETAEPVIVPASASALEQLGSDFEPANSHGSGPRRASQFFFNVPGLDEAEVSPN